jgi:ethanolamine kinase
LKHYVASFRYHSIDLNDTKSYEIDFEKDIDQLYDQIDAFRGLPGFYWGMSNPHHSFASTLTYLLGIWALIQSMISQIDFNYPEYAELRLGEYWAWKAEDSGLRARDGGEMPLRERRWAQE